MHYVCSDIHGQKELYDKMMEAIDLQPEDTLYVLGDVIDRGPDSIGILKDMMKRENVVMFLGNHELMMLDYFREVGRPDIWTMGCNGGTVTLRQYNKLPQEEQDEIFEYLMEAWIQKYVEVDGEKYALHHSCFLKDRRFEDVRFSETEDWDDVFDAVWNSPWRTWEYAPISSYEDGYTHIIGHVPVILIDESLKKPPYAVGPVINIDGGCAVIRHNLPGGLYCMTLEKDEKGNRKEFWFPGKKERKR